MCATFIYWHHRSPDPADAQTLTVIRGTAGEERILIDLLLRDYQDRVGAKIYFCLLWVDADLFLHAFEFDSPDRWRRSIVAAMRGKK